MLLKGTLYTATYKNAIYNFASRKNRDEFWANLEAYMHLNMAVTAPSV